MAQSLSVGPVVNEAVRFARFRFLTVLRWGWAPVVLSGLIFLGAFSMVADFKALEALEASGDASFAAFLQTFKAPTPTIILVGLIAYAAVTYLFSGVIASVARLAALGEDRPGLFHVRVDGPTNRAFAATIILSLINLAIGAVALLIGEQLTAGSLKDAGPAFMELIAIMEKAEGGAIDAPMETIQRLNTALAPYWAGFWVALVPAIYVNTKLAIFPAASAIENRLYLLGSFRDTIGSFWSILGAIVLIGVFLAIAGLIVDLSLSIFDQIAAFLSGQGAGLGIIGGVIALAVGAARLAFNLFVYGVQFSMPAIIYRRLKFAE